MAEHIGKRIRKIRLEKGIKQTFLAKKMGYKNSSSLNDIEHGRRGLSADKVPIVAKYLGVSVEEIFFGSKSRETRTKTTA